MPFLEIIPLGILDTRQIAYILELLEFFYVI